MTTILFIVYWDPGPMCVLPEMHVFSFEKSI